MILFDLCKRNDTAADTGVFGLISVMSVRRATPVIIGVHDVKIRSTKVEDAIEPMQLMLQAILGAIDDSNLPPSTTKQLQSQIDSIDVVRTWTWPYPDLPSLLSEKLGISPRHKSYSEHGGNKPAKLFDEAARRISQRQSKVAVVTGGEALASLSACAAAKKLPPPGWTSVEENVDAVFSPSTRDLGSNLGALHDIGAPIHVYPLFENGLRAHRGQSIEENNAESGALYAEFARVAESNSLAWSHGQPAKTAEEITTVSARNRMICLPYPLLMNAFNTVNLAGAVLLTSTEYAEELGVTKDRWIYPLGGAGTQDKTDFWERPNFYSSPSIERSIDAALGICGLSKNEIDLFDFYSCFPIVPKIACRHLGLPVTGRKKLVTLLGGLTSFGGAGNNYSMHAITEMVRQLREGRGDNGLVLANGGVMTYQHVLCLSKNRRGDGSTYPEENPLSEYITDVAAPVVQRQAEGDAVVETYTVEFKRDGSPLRGHVVGRLKSNGNRFIANHGDAITLQRLCSQHEDPIGKEGWVRKDSTREGRNLFTFDGISKL